VLHRSHTQLRCNCTQPSMDTTRMGRGLSEANSTLEGLLRILSVLSYLVGAIVH
jgi:hypothetical protein